MIRRIQEGIWRPLRRVHRGLPEGRTACHVNRELRTCVNHIADFSNLYMPYTDLALYWVCLFTEYASLLISWYIFTDVYGPSLGAHKTGKKWLLGVFTVDKASFCFWWFFSCLLEITQWCVYILVFLYAKVTVFLTVVSVHISYLIEGGPSAVPSGVSKVCGI